MIYEIVLSKNLLMSQFAVLCN